MRHTDRERRNEHQIGRLCGDADVGRVADTGRAGSPACVTQNFAVPPGANTTDKAALEWLWKGYPIP
jgi:nitroimidazol reductase NimA-like FMN-containing flavoprotein (pyridoxamine 5'-phosphate oxidase superfamily)